MKLDAIFDKYPNLKVFYQTNALKRDMCIRYLESNPSRYYQEGHAEVWLIGVMEGNPNIIDYQIAMGKPVGLNTARASLAAGDLVTHPGLSGDCLLQLDDEIIINQTGELIDWSVFNNKIIFEHNWYILEVD